MAATRKKGMQQKFMKKTWPSLCCQKANKLRLARGRSYMIFLPLVNSSIHQERGHWHLFLILLRSKRRGPWYWHEAFGCQKLNIQKRTKPYCSKKHRRTLPWPRFICPNSAANTLCHLFKNLPQDRSQNLALLICIPQPHNCIHWERVDIFLVLQFLSKGNLALTSLPTNLLAAYDITATSKPTGPTHTPLAIPQGKNLLTALITHSLPHFPTLPSLAFTVKGAGHKGPSSIFQPKKKKPLLCTLLLLSKPVTFQNLTCQYNHLATCILLSSNKRTQLCNRKILIHLVHNTKTDQPCLAFGQKSCLTLNTALPTITVWFISIFSSFLNLASMT